MLDSIVEILRCPVCRGALAQARGALRCSQGHCFDIARQGYATLLVGAAPAGDGSDMLAARAVAQEAGLFAPLADKLAGVVRDAAHGPVVDVGAGTGYYLASVLGAERSGLAMDLSKYAARRAARAHQRVVSVVADSTARLPVGDAEAAAVLCLFAPRNPDEFRRIVRPDGRLFVAVPASDHLIQLRERFGLLGIESGKEERLLASLAGRFAQEKEHSVRWQLPLSRQAMRALIMMGPSAYHVDSSGIDERIAETEDPLVVDASVRIVCFRPESS